MALWYKWCNWFPVGYTVSWRFPSPLLVQCQDMAACHKCRLDWTGKRISAGDTAAPLAWLSVRNGLHSQALHERFYMGTPKANWPMEIRNIVSSAWLPAAIAAIWVPNHHRAPHLTKQRALFLIPKKKKKRLSSFSLLHLLWPFSLFSPHLSMVIHVRNHCMNTHGFFFQHQTCAWMLKASDQMTPLKKPERSDQLLVHHQYWRREHTNAQGYI